MQRPAFSQSPKRVGSGPSRPPISFGASPATRGRSFGSVTDGEPSGATSVMLSADSAPEFVSVTGPDDDGGRLLDMEVVCQSATDAGTVRGSFVTRLDFGFHEPVAPDLPHPNTVNHRESMMISNMAAASPVPADIARLTQLGIIMVTGPQAREYLQGQVTADLDQLNAEQVQLACCNSAQGRVQAVFWMMERSDGIALVLPASILDSTVTRLRKYVLRAKAKVEPAPHLQVGFIAREHLPADTALPGAKSHRRVENLSYFTLPGHADVLLVGAFDASGDAAREHQWKLAELRAGLPQVYPETHEAFVAQMLNIDLLGGISFEKGCYTGQEIIARAHFRGAVKRRMFLFRTDGAPPPPGTRVLAGDHHAGDVVDSVATDNGCELLAVISLPQLKNELRLEGQTATLERLDLPYPVAEA